MLGSLNHNLKNIKIIGAGISGLMTGYYLSKNGFKVTIYEKNSHSGGLIKTIDTPFGPIEDAAHSCLHSPGADKLLAQINNKKITANFKRSNKFIVDDNQVKKIFYALSWKEKLLTLKHILFNKSPGQYKSLQHWGNIHLGKAATDKLLSPRTESTFGALPQDLDLQATFPQWQLAKNKRFISVLLKAFSKEKSQSALLSSQGGMQDFIKCLQKNIITQGGKILYNQIIDNIDDNSNTIIATNAINASTILANIDKKSAHALQAISYSPLCVVTIFLPKNTIKNGLGVLFASTCKTKVSGILYNSSIFKKNYNKYDCVSIFIACSRDKYLINKDDVEIYKIAKLSLNTLITKTEPLHYYIGKYPFGLPLYNSKLLNSWNILKTNWCNKPGNIIIGNYTGKIGIGGIADSITTML